MTPQEIELHFLLPGSPPDVEEIVAGLHSLDVLPPLTLSKDHAAVWQIDAQQGSESWSIRPARSNPEVAEELIYEELDEADAEVVLASSWALVVRGTLPPSGLIEGYQRLLRVGLAAAPKVVAVFDINAGILRPASWLRDATVSGIPLAPDMLYRVRVLQGDDGDHWCYTHGLKRLGMSDIEILDVHDDQLQTALATLSAVANHAILCRLPVMGEEVSYAHKLRATLIPWRYLLEHLKITAGRTEDREDGLTEEHLALVQWVPTSDSTGIWQSLSKALFPDDPPVFTLTDYETDRMEALSRLRWNSFASLVHTYAGADGWRFLAKFGYGGSGGITREHLWFDVHRADALSAEATLLNAPYQDNLGLTEGDRGTHPIDHLTDFRIGSPVGTATPESIGILLVTLVQSFDSEVH